MSQVHRVCPDCSKNMSLDARHCPACGYDTQAGLPAPSRNLPATFTRAALPVLAGAATFALRAGWRLLQSRLAQQAAQRAIDVVIPQTPRAAPAAETQIQATQPPPATHPRRTIRIRSSWAVGDANGVWQQGTSEHTIEIDD